MLPFVHALQSEDRFFSVIFPFPFYEDIKMKLFKTSSYFFATALFALTIPVSAAGNQKIGDRGVRKLAKRAKASKEYVIRSRFVHVSILHGLLSFAHSVKISPT